MTGRALIYEGSGRFAVAEASAVPPGKGEVRLDVAFCGICGTDLHIAHGAMDARIPTPMVIGHEMSGTVVGVGAGVDAVRPGDHVVVRPLDTRESTLADRASAISAASSSSSGSTRRAHCRHHGPCLPSPSTRSRRLLDLRLAALAEPLAVACHDVVVAGELAEPAETALVSAVARSER